MLFYFPTNFGSARKLFSFSHPQPLALGAYKFPAVFIFIRTLEKLYREKAVLRLSVWSFVACDYHGLSFYRTH